MMDPEDVGRVLAVAAAYDRRTVGRTDIIAWGKSLDGYDPRACAEAIRAHYADPDTCGQYLLPGHVLGRIRNAHRAAIHHAQTDRVLAEIEEAKASADTLAADRARIEARRAFAQAIEAKHARELPAGEPETAEVASS